MISLRAIAIRASLIAISATLLAPISWTPALAAETSTTTSSYDFYLALPPAAGDESWTLYLTSSETGTALIDYPTGSDTAITVRPRIVSSLAVSSTFKIGDNDEGLISNKLIKISSSVPTTVYACSRGPGNPGSVASDCTHLIPKSAWGSRYRALSYNTDASSVGRGDRLTLLAGGVSSTVKIRFKSAVSTGLGSFTAGQETTISLGAQEIFSVEAPSNGQGFSGTLITSSTPIGVLTGNELSYGFGDGTLDTTLEMLPPTSSWGVNHYLNNYKNSNSTTRGSGVRIVVDQDSTTIQIRGDETVTTTLNAGDVYSSLLFNKTPTNTSISITSNKPILVGHYMRGAGWYNSTGINYSGDPSLSFISPSEQLLTSYTFINVTGFSAQFVNVMIPDSAISSLRLNDTTVASSNFRSIGSTGWSSAQLNMSTGSHTISANMAFGIEVYGANNADSYAYVGGANYSFISSVAAIRVTATSQSGTVGQQVCIPVSVRDGGDAVVPGVRVDGTVTGTNGTSYVSALTDSSGNSNLCYTGTLAGRDTLTATSNGYSATVTVNWTLAAPDITYLPSSIQLATSASMRTLSPTNTGGTVASWTISPALPSGLSLNSSTGVISGTPNANQSATNYTVTATNAAGSDAETISISVAAGQSPTISYSPSTYSFTLDSSISTLIPTTSGTFPTWTVSPALPSGLSLNSQNGRITGTPTRVTTSSTYTVTATNSAGSANTSLVLEVNALPPDISFTLSSYSFGVNQAITTITPLNTGSPATSWTISPSLPAGLAFNSSTGQISGTPSATSAATSYTVTGTNSAGSDSTIVSLAVTASLQAPSISYSPSTVIARVDSAITTLTPTNSGGTASSWSISTTLPSGLTFSTLSGVITGTPTTTLPQTNFTITATNSAGSSTSIVTLTVRGLPGSSGAPSVTITITGGQITKGANLTISATTSQAGRVTFYEKGILLKGCQNRATSALVATCAWRPKYHGSSNITATVAPTDDLFSTGTAQASVTVLKRSTRS